ncbi:hypothetical protein ACHQM5_012535 [Ranunculus cassubicifolius]
MAPISLRFSPALSIRAKNEITTTNTESSQPIKTQIQNSRVLILGGTGTVGGSTALALSKLSPNLRLVVGGRNREKGDGLVSKLGENSEFVQVDIENVRALESALRDVDLVVHAAGPFQRAEKCTVLEAAISTKTAYMDVCDDADYSIKAKSFHEKTVAANIPAITTAGIYPGVSNGDTTFLLYSVFSHKLEDSGRKNLTTIVVKLDVHIHLLLIENLWSDLRNLPEVRSIHKILGVPTVCARFGTAPFFWNWGMLAMTLVPSEILRDRNKVQKLAELFDPVVRALDKYSGERVSMRVDLDCSNGRNTVGIFSHKKLSVSVGISTAAFALAILEGSAQPGVWFPEEPQGIAVDDRQLLLNRASQGCINFVMDQMPWMVESEPKELVFGIYL